MPPRETPEHSSNSRTRARARRAAQTQSTGQRITFVDSRDPNIRSTIQRHTAHHTNQQRRDARLQSLRSTSRPRVLEWQRRLNTAEGLGQSPPTSTSTSSPASVSPLSQPAIVTATATTATTIPLIVSSEASSAPDDYRSTLAGLVEHRTNYDQDETGLRQTCEIKSLCPRNQKTNARKVTSVACPHAESPELLQQVIQFADRDRASSILLSSYAICLRIYYNQSTDPESDRNRARVYLIRGTALLMNRLSDSRHASSDENIQAVLLLIVITTDFPDLGNPGESYLHQSALRTMLTERGGPTTLPDVLRIQATSLDTTRSYHLTLNCGHHCDQPYRFASDYDFDHDLEL